MRRTAAILASNTGKEPKPGEPALIERARLIQFMSSGTDFVPLNLLPEAIPVAGNGGTYAEPMAERGLAMVLAAAKKPLVQHNALARGEFNQMAPNRTLAGGVRGILGSAGSASPSPG